MRQSLLGPAGLALAAVLVVCVIAPPEVSGSGLAAMALFVAVAAAGVSATAAGSPASRWVFAMALVAAVATRTACAPGEAVEPAACMALAALAGVSAAQAVGRDELFARLFGVLLAYAGVRALVAAPAGDALTGFLIMTMPAVAAWAFGKRGIVRAFGLAAAALGAAGLVATRSVPAMAGLVLAAALASLRGRVAPRALGFSAAAIGLAVVCAGIAKPDAVVAAASENGPSRLVAGDVRVALAIARDHPLAGVGPGGFAEAAPHYRRPGDGDSRHAHNLPAELVAEWGVPAGLALSALFFGLFVGPALRTTGDARTLSHGLAIGVAAFALHNLAGVSAFLPSALICAAVCRGLLVQQDSGVRATPVARAAWSALALAIAVLSAGSGLARDALFYARAAAVAGDHAEALRFARRAKAVAPWDADAPLFAAGALMAAGSAAPLALEEAEQAIDRAPSRASARSVRARARTASGDATGAYADMVEASRLDPLRLEYASQRDALAEALGKASESARR